MGQFSAEIYALPGSLLSGNQQLGHVSSIVPRGVACPAAAFEGRRSVRLAVNSASSTIPCRASSSLISRCSHYVCQIVVWRTNLEVTPTAHSYSQITPARTALAVSRFDLLGQLGQVFGIK